MDIFAPSHLLILLVIILIIFGPSKLGDVGGAMGKAIRDFKRAARRYQGRYEDRRARHPRNQTRQNPVSRHRVECHTTASESLHSGLSR